MLLKCKQCGKQFTSERSLRKFCSRECSHKNRQYNLLGGKFGNLTVIKRIGLDGNKGVLWLCKCDCGNEVKRHTNRLVNGNNQSCGCIRKISFGLVKDRFYKKYNSMHLRCEYQKSDSYHLYGGRGIRCERKTFQEFYKDMYPSYVEHCKKFGQEKTTLDRIDSNGNYCKENCRWATHKEQSNNRSTNRYIEHDGERLTISQWADKIGISYSALSAKLRRGVPMGWIVRHPHKRWYSYHDIDAQLKKYV